MSVGEKWTIEAAVSKALSIPVRRYCTVLASSELLKTALRERGWHYRLDWRPERGFMAIVCTESPYYSVGEWVGAESEPIALCLAVLDACERLAVAVKSAEGAKGAGDLRPDAQ